MRQRHQAHVSAAPSAVRYTRMRLPHRLISLTFAAVALGAGFRALAAGSERFADIDRTAQAAFSAEGIRGMGLAIHDASGALLFERMYGDFSPDERVPIASASKLISGVVLFRLIDAGRLSLDSTTGQVLGWTGANAGITLRQLLSFTSGLKPTNFCTNVRWFTLAECVNRIAGVAPIGAPGSRFDYGSTHLDVAGRMAEVVTGKPWNAVFAEQLGAPLGLPADLRYYANPLRSVGEDNPLLAGGLRMSMNEYEPVLHLVFDKGRWHGAQLISEQIFDEQAKAPYPQAVIGRTPGGSVRYGLTAWLECAEPQTGCARISSPGAFGFTPWVDREHGYYAILGMDDRHNGVHRFGVELERRLQPLIEKALAGR